MKKSKILFFAILALALSFLSCRNPTSANPQLINVIWEKTYGNSFADYARSIEQTSDGGYIIGGTSWHFWELPKTHIIKTDAQGIIEWQKEFDDEAAIVVYRIFETSEGGFVAAGVAPRIGKLQFIRMDTKGDTLWTKLYSGSSLMVPYSIIMVADGNFIITGSIDTYMGLVKLNRYAEHVWTSIYLDSSYALGTSVALTLDREYIICGVEYASQSTGVLVKAHGNGDKIWTRRFSVPGAQLFFSDVFPTLDGGYIVAGSVFSEATLDDGYLLKVNSSGDSVWAAILGGYDEDVFNSVQQTAFGNYVAAGKSRSFGSGYEDIYLALVDANGDSIASLIYGGAGYETSYDMEKTIDGNYAIIGTTNSFGAGNNDILFLKISAP
jgi:hypothetical protein